MGKSDEFIDYSAYTRYLKKVTGEPADPQKLKDAVFAQAVEKTEMQTALMLLKRLSVAAAVVALCALGVAGFSYASSLEKQPEEEGIWVVAREDDKGSNGALRLYEAYEHSKTIREKFL